MQSMARDVGRKVSIRLTAIKGIASRVGLGKIRHLDSGLQWIQHHVSRRNLQVHMVAGSENKEDIGPKDVNAETRN